MVSAALGHSTGELVWKRYAHVFGEARLAPNVSMVDAVYAARATAEGTDPPSDTNASADFRRHLAQVLTRRAVEQALAR